MSEQQTYESVDHFSNVNVDDTILVMGGAFDLAEKPLLFYVTDIARKEGEDKAIYTLMHAGRMFLLEARDDADVTICSI